MEYGKDWKEKHILWGGMALKEREKNKTKQNVLHFSGLVYVWLQHANYYYYYYYLFGISNIQYKVK